MVMMGVKNEEFFKLLLVQISKMSTYLNDKMHLKNLQAKK
jgi:hypothetical protein